MRANPKCWLNLDLYPDVEYEPVVVPPARCRLGLHSLSFFGKVRQICPPSPLVGEVVKICHHCRRIKFYAFTGRVPWRHWEDKDLPGMG
jgi:hypothetical protein